MAAPDPLPQFVEGKTYWMSGATLNRIVNGIVSRTPLSGSGIRADLGAGGTVISVVGGEAGAAAGEYIGPFMLTCEVVDEVTSVTIGDGQYLNISTGAQGTINGSGSGNGVAYIDLPGTTTNGYFTPDTPEVGYDESLPSDTSTNKYFEIGSVSGGVCTQKLKSDFFFG